eukprot:CAMPEP_0115054730 /NCGR_PEP_ID=MMETSP0227-20121206/4255_1 /TAXON_ID=89957 /ORGANISM="Polarella glacialis, Strain CCMP 1383" /LENGTH=171 /DNA_ID=CAMNT_0002439235 /DNA_START=703 /DNA_END=1219 /DNA_ORIENTATION=+
MAQFGVTVCDRHNKNRTPIRSLGMDDCCCNCIRSECQSAGGAPHGQQSCPDFAEQFGIAASAKSSIVRASPAEDCLYILLLEAQVFRPSRHRKPLTWLSVDKEGESLYPFLVSQSVRAVLILRLLKANRDAIKNNVCHGRGDGALWVPETRVQEPILHSSWWSEVDKATSG